MINNDKAISLFRQIKEQTDEEAFSRLFDHCFADLMRFAYSFVHSRSLSEEIASDVLLRLWRQKEQLDIASDFRLYLYVSVRNAAYNHLRKEKKHTIVSLDHTSVWLKADSVSPEDVLITRELQGKINDAIQQLPARCRLVFKLIKEDGLAYKEAATLLGLSVKTIEAQMSIAMKRLFRVFHNYLQAPLPNTAVSRTSK